MNLALRRIVRDQQRARLAQRYRVFESRFAERSSGDLAGNCDRARRVHGCLQAQMVRALGQLHLVRANRFSLRAEFHLGLRRCGRFERHIHRKPLATEYLAGKRNRFEHQARLGTAGKRHRVHRNAELLRLPDCARDASQIFVTVGNQQQARHHPRRQRRGSIADRRFQIGSASADAGGVAELPFVLRPLGKQASRVDRANGITRDQWRPRALSKRSA